MDLVLLLAGAAGAGVLGFESALVLGLVLELEEELEEELASLLAADL